MKTSVFLTSLCLSFAAVAADMVTPPPMPSSKGRTVAESPALKSTDVPMDDAQQELFKVAVALLNGYQGNSSQLSMAKRKLGELLDKNPKCAPAYREMARYFIMSGHMTYQNFSPGSLEAAEQAINKALQLRPNFAEAYVLQGHLYRLMDRVPEAFAALQKAEKIGTNDPWLHNNWADLLLDQGNPFEAVKHFNKVIDSNTPNRKAMSAAISGVLRYYQQIGNYTKVDETYQRLIAFDPNSAWPYGNYSQFLLCSMDKYEAAITQAEMALINMDYGVGHQILATALYRRWAEQLNSNKITDAQKTMSLAKSHSGRSPQDLYEEYCYPENKATKEVNRALTSPAYKKSLKTPSKGRQRPTKPGDDKSET